MKKIILALTLIVLFALCTGEAVAAKDLSAAPIMKETSCLEDNGKVFLNFIFASSKGEKYRVYRRSDGTKQFQKLGDIVAKGATTTYKDTKVKKNAVYYYTVRRVYNNNKSLSKYDTVGIKAICIDTAPSVSLTNMQATVRFKTSPLATGYILYRKAPGDTWRKIASFKATQKSTLQFADTYYKTATRATEKKHLINNTFVDPTANPFRYEVRAIYSDTAKGYISRGLYYQEGACVVGTPALSSVAVKSGKATVHWSSVPAAKSYNVYAKTSKYASWVKLAGVKATDKGIESLSIKVKRNYTFYTVKAFVNVRGKLVGSEYEKEFYIGKRTMGNKKALFLGDSIALGRPYKGNNLTYFNYAKRVEQMLGMRCDNIAITASTISDVHVKRQKQSILIDQFRQVYVGKKPNTPEGYPTPPAPLPIWQYDYIVLQGGTNDYSFCVPFGEADSKDIGTLNGALNSFKQMVKQINTTRKSKGLANVKIIVMDITYSLRCGSDYQTVRCKQTTKNALGVTATDYTNTIHENLDNEGLNIRYIPATAVLNEENCLKESADNLHLTKVGYGKMGKVIADTILYW